MRILIVNAEIPPAATADDSADFAQTLARGLRALHHDARVAVPCYGFVEDDARLNVRPVLDDLALAWEDGSTRSAYLATCAIDGVPFYLIGSEGRFRRAARLDGEDCAFLARGIRAALKAIRPRWLPDVVHINDLSPGLAAVYLNALYLREWDINPAAFVTSVHSEAKSRRANTLVTGSRLDPDVRVVKRYRSRRRLADVYGRIYNEILAQRETRALAA